MKNRIEQFEKRIDQEQNHFKKIKMTIALNKIKKELEKNGR